MGRYVESSLMPNEQVLHSGQVSMWSLLIWIILGLVTLPFLGLGLLIWVGAYLHHKSTELAFTNQRLIAKFGFISRKTVELNVHKIESIQVNQTIGRRIFNYGTLIVAGAGSPQAPIPGIAAPLEFRRALMAFSHQQPTTR